jgi:peptidyl-prolyl cis-trans isomerase SurA
MNIKMCKIRVSLRALLFRVWQSFFSRRLHLVIAVLCMIPGAHADTPPSDAIIAVVNDDVITIKDLRQYLASIASQLRVENKSPEEIQQIMGSYEQKGLDKLIEDKLVLAAANDKGIEVRGDIVDKHLKEIKDRYTNENDFLKAISAEGLTVSDLKQKMSDQLKVKYEVDLEVRDKIFVNPQDVTNYYNKHRDEFNRKSRVNLQSIFVSFDKHSKQEAESRVQEARSRMLAGEDFDKILQKYSDGTSVGEVEEGQMVDAVENVVFKLKLNEVSDPVQVENGIYVFKAIGILSGKQQDLIEVKDQIYSKLMDDQFQAKFKVLIDKLREKAYVEIK